MRAKVDVNMIAQVEMLEDAIFSNFEAECKVELRSREAFQYLKPCGCVENQEFDCMVCSDDNSMRPDSKMKERCEMWCRGFEIAGASRRWDHYLMAVQMKEAGFVNVEVMEFKMPIGSWLKDKSL